MNNTHKKLHLAPLTLAIASLPLSAHADFISDSKASITARNFYYNHDLRDSTKPAQSKIEEWAQGFIFKAQSGYTEGFIGFGVDVYAGLGLKLDSSPSRSGSALLPGAYKHAGQARNADPRSVDEYSEATAAVKMKISKSELKVGGLFPKLPILQAGDARLLPQFFEGAMLSVREFDNLDFDLGSVNRVNYREFAGARKIQVGNYWTVESERFTYGGATWRITPDASVGVWQGELKDVYQQSLITSTLNKQLGDWKLGAQLNYMYTREAGEEMAGKLDSRMPSAMLSAGLGPQTFRLGYQYNAGGSALPFMHDTDLPAAANAVQVLRFDRADERSWQARYDFDFAGVGVPGLVAMARYVHGDNFKYQGRDAEEWERNIDLTYTVQSGTFKNVSFRLRNVELVGDVTGRRDENRFIVSYTLPLL
ncbi:outer membrane porin [Pseudomonas sp. StFLB209]|uniref:OprD family porin n=1 Tax=Pseudomonas sp. StFLB209 TaxID=1028989 RepID=UPI0004F8236A|nr:OprD family porin [Pseudomonas sp. StFLB209]BAP43238.1 outer membrane porin [Pseudomonas sp. StFLB209]